MPRKKGRKAKKQVPVVIYVEGEPVTLHKGTGQGYVRLPDGSGKKNVYYVGQLYLDTGRSHVSQTALDRAGRLIRESKALGAVVPKGELTVQQLADRFDAHAREYYGQGCGEPAIFGYALRHVLALYGSQAASEFSPLGLMAARNRMLEHEDWTRKTVNEYVQRVRRVFRWGAAHELVPAEVYVKLQTVEGLRKGRTTAREPRKVHPANRADVDAVLNVVVTPVAAMIRLQLLTGMRPGEVVIMRPCDIDRVGEVWTYQPAAHKTEHLDHERLVDLGPQAQAVLAPFLLGRPSGAFCFSPKESMEEIQHARHARRKTPPTYGNRPGSNRKVNPRREPQERYAVPSYRRAIARVCERLGVARWSPHQLRHLAATELRQKYGIEAARVVLGHRDIGATLIYAEADRELARRVAIEVG